MTALSPSTTTDITTDSPAVVLRSGALLHRVRSAAAAVWPLAPGRYLAISDGDDVVVMRLGGVTRIGRRASSDIVLDDNSVSRRHALVLDRAGKPVIADDRSRNGVFVNGRRVREARLHHGDEVQIGARIMRYLEVSPAGETLVPRAHLRRRYGATNASNAGRADPSASRSPQS